MQNTHAESPKTNSLVNSKLKSEACKSWQEERNLDSLMKYLVWYVHADAHVNTCKYENGQRLEGKPFEFRESGPRFYINFMGTAIVAVPTVMGILWAFFCLFSYTVRDSQVCINRRNPHPFLAIKNGEDMKKTFNPFLGKAIPFSVLNQDYKMLFYNEFSKAHKRSL